MTSLFENWGTPERFHPRIEADITVEVEINGRPFVTKARNLSMAGLYLLGWPPAPIREVTVTIPLPGDREIVTVADVKRRGPDGVALEFHQLDWDDLLALARYLHPRLP